MIYSCCVEGCREEAVWMMLWLNSSRSGKQKELADKKYVCNGSWHIVPQRSGRYPDAIVHLQTGREYDGLIEDRAREFKCSS